MQDLEIFSLPNGMRVIHRQVSRPVAHLGLVIGVGSRDEKEGEVGLAHFIEHCLFKGTKRRKAYHILSRMEDVGGELNAYTSKEETLIYTSFLKADYPRAIELLADIGFGSLFPDREVQKEKAVIIDEINSYRDSPSDLIFDDFEALVFPEHPLGNNILGDEKSVSTFSRQHIRQFMEREYGPDRMVISSVGNISLHKLKKLLMRHLPEQLPFSGSGLRSEPTAAKGSVQKLEKNVYQTHAVLGGWAYPIQGDKAKALLLLNNMLGGPGMNSRLNLNIREKYGFTYHIESYYQAYSDSGLFGIYLGTEPDKAERSIQLALRELDKLRLKPLGSMQLHKAKKQLIGQIAMAQENNGALMSSLGRALVHFDKIDTLEEAVRDIENISASEIQEVAQEIFDPNTLNFLQYNNENPD